MDIIQKIEELYWKSEAKKDRIKSMQEVLNSELRDLHAMHTSLAEQISAFKALQHLHIPTMKIVGDHHAQ